MNGYISISDKTYKKIVRATGAGSIEKEEPLCGCGLPTSTIRHHLPLKSITYPGKPFVLPNMNALQYLSGLVKGVWDHSANKVSSGSSIRRWIGDGTIAVNGERVDAKEMLDFPVFSIVVFPKSPTRRVTLL